MADRRAAVARVSADRSPEDTNAWLGPPKQREESGRALVVRTGGPEEKGGPATPGGRGDRARWSEQAAGAVGIAVTGAAAAPQEVVLEQDAAFGGAAEPV